MYRETQVGLGDRGGGGGGFLYLMMLYLNVLYSTKT